ncbi:hypothetical protein, partial [Salmonella enterica]|uniref:hypothetical protein n=1 Tax=Salmonella enterica TaxID=28901 RepID=UPI001A9C5749
ASTIRSGEVLATVSLSGPLDDNFRRDTLRCRVQLDFSSSSPVFKVSATVTNPQPASHPGGLWDLGKAGSEEIQAIFFRLRLAESQE